MPRPATIREVARAAGVSTVTVSRVVNSPELVLPATRARVERAMRELGYVPNLAARSMRTSSTRSIGILVPDLVNHPNAAVAQAAERHLAAAGYCLLLTSSDYDPRQEVRAIEALRTRQVDGMMLYLSDEDDPALRDAVRDLRIPCVVLDRSLGVATDLVLSEHGRAMREAVRYLVLLGHRRLALLVAGLRVRPMRERCAAFTTATAEAGLAPGRQRVVAVSPAELARADMPGSLLEDPERPTAVLVDGSRLTRALLAAARARGLHIPRDLSVIGIDTADIASATDPELTAISRDFAAIGRTGAGLLLERLREPNAAPRQVTLESEVILRGSCGPPPRAATPGPAKPAMRPALSTA